MSIVKRARSAAGVPLRLQSQVVTRGVEDLMHAIKNELVGRFDFVDGSLHEIRTSTSDQLSLLSARVSGLEAELKKLRAEVAAAKK